MKNTVMSWLDIWSEKGKRGYGPLHHLNGFDMLSVEQYDQLVRKTIEPVSIRSRQRILELGCGAGAYLDSLLRQFGNLSVQGIDYSEPLIEHARKKIPTGSFSVSDLIQPGGLGLSGNSFDLVFSFGVFLYFKSLADVENVLAQMVHSTKPGGSIYIGDVSDAEKKSLADELRKETHKNQQKLSAITPDHLYIHKKTFEDFAKRNHCVLRIVDGDQIEGLGEFYKNSFYRYHVYLVKP